MENKNSLKNFRSVLESEVLNEEQMNGLEAGGACEQGCKKSCKPDNQNSKTTLKIDCEDKDLDGIYDILDQTM